MVSLYTTLVTKLNFLFLLANILIKASKLNEYKYVWRSKVNKKSYIGKWVNNYARFNMSTDLKGYFNYKKNLLNTKIFWLSFYSPNFKYSVKKKLFDNISIKTGFPKIWKVNYSK